MHSINPQIYHRKYDSGTKYWLVKCQLPGGKAHQSKHPNEADAEKERYRLIREFSGGSLTADQARDFELAQRRLDTCKGDAREKSILEAVDYFIANFKDTSSSPTVAHCVAEFSKAHVVKKRANTVEEYGRYLDRLEERFGKYKITDLNRKVLTEYVAAFPSAGHHRKCLVAFFGYCSGTSRKIPNPTPWLKENEARWIPLPPKGDDHEIVILSLEEVKNALALALMYDDLPYWIWALYTGMRPDEIRKFWSLPGYGWERINLGGNYIVVNSEISKDKRRRKILIRPNLKRWLLLFKQADERMYPACHRLKFRAIKSALFLPEKCRIRDLLRHTYVSFRAAAFDHSLAVTAAESGNSEKIIKEFYLDLITNSADVDEYWNLTPASFGLPEADPDCVTSGEMLNFEPTEQAS